MSNAKKREQVVAGIDRLKESRAPPIESLRLLPHLDVSKAIGNDVVEWPRRVDDRIGEPRQITAQFCFNSMGCGSSKVIPVSAVTDSRQPVYVARFQEEEPGGRGSGNARQDTEDVDVTDAVDKKIITWLKAASSQNRSTECFGIGLDKALSEVLQRFTGMGIAACLRNLCP
jgi:hypothetical protein